MTIVREEENGNNGHHAGGVWRGGRCPSSLDTRAGALRASVGSTEVRRTAACIAAGSVRGEPADEPRGAGRAASSRSSAETPSGPIRTHPNIGLPVMSNARTWVPAARSVLVRADAGDQRVLPHPDAQIAAQQGPDVPPTSSFSTNAPWLALRPRIRQPTLGRTPFAIPLSLYSKSDPRRSVAIDHNSPTT